MSTTDRYPVRLTSEQLDLLSDAVSYYLSADMGGGGDHDNAHDRHLLRDIDHRIESCRTKAQAVDARRHANPVLRAAGEGPGGDPFAGFPKDGGRF